MDNIVKLLIAVAVIRFIYKLVVSRAQPKAGGESSTASSSPPQEKSKGWLEEVAEKFKEEFKEQFEPEVVPTRKPATQEQAPVSKTVRTNFDTNGKTETSHKIDTRDLKYQAIEVEVNTTGGLDSIMENYTTEQKMIIFQALMEKPSDSNR
ncbi:MAG: hypothetical protein ABUK01_10930 [Leptospirales bacterium]